MAVTVTAPSSHARAYREAMCGGRKSPDKGIIVRSEGTTMKRDRSHASEFVRQIRVDKIREEGKD
jgi:hypothetical protein